MSILNEKRHDPLHHKLFILWLQVKSLLSALHFIMRPGRAWEFSLIFFEDMCVRDLAIPDSTDIQWNCLDIIHWETSRPYDHYREMSTLPPYNLWNRFSTAKSMLTKDTAGHHKSVISDMHCMQLRNEGFQSPGAGSNDCASFSFSSWLFIVHNIPTVSGVAKTLP